MRLTEDEFVECLETFSKIYQEESEILDALDCSPDWKPSEWINSYYSMLSLMCDFSEGQYESPYGTPMDYYCWETDFGKSADAEIKSPKELYQYIMDCEKRNENG
jgi:hypothetical protein